MLSHPAFFPALVGGDAQREAFFAQQNVAAVCRVHGNDGVVLGEVADIALFGVNVALAVQAAHPVVAVAQHVQHLFAHAGHDAHVEDNVYRVGHFDAGFGDGGADGAHGVGDNVHRTALVGSAGNIVQLGVHFLRIAPVVGGAGVLLVAAAYECAVFDAGNVVGLRSMQIAVRKQFLIQFDHFAGGNGLCAQRFDLLVAAVDPDDFIGVDQGLNFFQPAKYRNVRGHFVSSLRSIFEQIHYSPPACKKQGQE